jgi:hypothetical protein
MGSSGIEKTEGGEMQIRESEGSASTLGLNFGTNQHAVSGGFSRISDTESLRFRRVPTQVLWIRPPFAILPA